MTTAAAEKKLYAVKNLSSTKSRVAEIALAYGFSQIGNIRITSKDKEMSHSIAREYETEPNREGEEKVALLRFYNEEKIGRSMSPSSFFREERTSRGGLIFRIDMIGCRKSISEALVIKTVSEILKDSGALQFSLRINSHGDRESFNRFVRELKNFYSKKKDVLHNSCSSVISSDFLAPIYCQHKECADACSEAPTPVCFLSEPARAHFKEVLEYIESIKIPYILSERFFGPIGIASHTVFDIRDNNGTLLANGFRYNHLARRMGFRHDIPALGATISIKNIQLAKRRKETPAKIYIIQIGNEAKRVSLNLLEEFRRAEIKTAHNLSHDKISSQIEHAENLQTPYLAIIGHKEALEGTILIRDRERSFQETLPTPDAIHFLKKLLA